MQRRIITRIAVLAGTVIAAAGMTGLTGSAANAADPSEPTPILTVTYDVKGNTQLKKTGVNVYLGPTKLTAALEGDEAGSLLATLPIPPRTVQFKAFGYLPVKATVYFTQVGPVTGNLTDGPDGTVVSSNAQYVVTLRNVFVGGAAANVGDNCQTRYPVNIFVSTPAGETFNLGNGGNLTGTYDLGTFNNCSTSTALTNLIVPSNNNKIGLKLSNLQIIDNDASATSKKLSKQLSAKLAK